MENNGYIKELPVVDKKMRGNVRKFEIICIYKNQPNLTELRDICGKCKKPNPKTTIAVSGKPPYEESGNLYGCGIPIKLIINIDEKGLPQLTQKIEYRSGLSKPIIPITKEIGKYYYAEMKSHNKWGL
ncbi:MAG: hypothetical protein WA139_06295 [Candidatus Aenigmatarchaeota archaeon]